MWWSLFILPLSMVLSQPVVDTDSGQIQGQTILTHYEGISVNSFHGIPFATPPTGDLRFQLPQPVDPWDDVFVADTLPTACIQNTGGWLWITHPGWNRHGEDCLYMDVYAPEDMTPQTLYPVMVFFHGGAYQSGAMIQYPGHHYAARDVVMVVPNYRMGIFGFVSTNDEVAPGNYGLYDQRLALQWVQDNIVHFGGDPNKVTIFGQSAGAGSVGLHMVSPGSQGLFHQVIEQSGSDLNFWAFNWPASQPHTYGERAAAELGCDTSSTQAWIDCLREQDPWVLLNATNPLECNPGYFCLGFAPVVDGVAANVVDPFVPDIPLEMRKRGEVNSFPVMTGFLTEDGALYTLAYIPEAMEGGFTREEFQFHLREDLLGMWTPQLDEKMNEDVYQALDWYYTPWPYLNDTEMNRQAFNKMVTDGAFGGPSERLAEFNSARAPTYQYVFGYRSNVTYDGILEGTDWMKVFHSAELPYVFGWPLLQLSNEVRLDTRILIDLAPWNQDDIDYAEFIIDLWSNFAKFGNPTPEPIENPPFENEPVEFQPYSAQNEEFKSLLMAENIENVDGYRQQMKMFWVEYLTYIMERDWYSSKTTDYKTGKTMSSDWINTFPNQDRLENWASTD